MVCKHSSAIAWNEQHFVATSHWLEGQVASRLKQFLGVSLHLNSSQVVCCCMVVKQCLTSPQCINKSTNHFLHQLNSTISPKKQGHAYGAASTKLLMPNHPCKQMSPIYITTELNHLLSVLRPGTLHRQWRHEYIVRYQPCPLQSICQLAMA